MPSNSADKDPSIRRRRSPVAVLLTVAALALGSIGLAIDQYHGSSHKPSHPNSLGSPPHPGDIPIHGLVVGEKITDIPVLKPEYHEDKQFILGTGSKDESEDLALVYSKDYSDSIVRKVSKDDTTDALGILLTSVKGDIELSSVDFNRKTLRVVTIKPVAKITEPTMIFEYDLPHTDDYISVGVIPEGSGEMELLFYGERPPVPEPTTTKPINA